MRFQGLVGVVVSLAMLLVAATTVRGNPDPRQGRFLQRDPNASGQIVLNDRTWFMGRAPIVGAPYASVREQYGDGANLYEYLGSNPTNRSDPMGLSWDPFDEVDDVAWLHQASGYLAIAKVDAFFKDREILKKLRAYEQAAFLWDDMVIDRDAGILLGLILGPLGARACFEEGTLVATPAGLVPIEEIGLGWEVTSWVDPLAQGSNEPIVAAGTQDWLVVTLELPRQDGSCTTIELLRPREWVVERRIRLGSFVLLELSEPGINGEAAVTSLDAFRGRLPVGAPIATGRFVTTNAPLLQLSLEGLEAPIGVTASHPFFSAERRRWVAAGQLRVGEAIRTFDGVATVRAIEPRSARRTVVNLEVDRTHTYFVSQKQAWVHNGCVPEWAKQSPRSFRSWAGQFGSPKGTDRIPKQFVQEVADEAARLGFRNIRIEVGGPRSGSWTGIPHINISVPDGGRVLHILIEGLP